MAPSLVTGLTTRSSSGRSSLISLSSESRRARPCRVSISPLGQPRGTTCQGHHHLSPSRPPCYCSVAQWRGSEPPVVLGGPRPLAPPNPLAVRKIAPTPASYLPARARATGSRRRFPSPPPASQHPS